MEGFKKAHKELTEVYYEINRTKKKYGDYCKCSFHLHTPASYDYALLEEKREKDGGDFYLSCTEKELLGICAKYNLIPETAEFDISNDPRFEAFEHLKEALTYLLIAQELIKKEIEMVLITDHNTIEGHKKLEVAIEIMKDYKPCNDVYPEVILGVEINCADKNHVVGIFKSDKDSKLKIEKFLDEIILSKQDGTYFTSIQVMEEIVKLKGIPYIAHIDTSNMFKESKYLSGAYKKKLLNSRCFHAVGLSNISNQGMYAKMIGEYRDHECCFLVDEDSHSIDTIGSKTFWLKGKKRDFHTIRSAFRDYNISLQYEKPERPQIYIKGLLLKNGKNGFLINQKNGKKENFCLNFSDSLNCFIGGRGSGKSTILKLIDFVLRQNYGSKEDLEYFCKLGSVWLLIQFEEKEYMLNFYPPERENEGETFSILKYFSNTVNHRHHYKYEFDKNSIEEYTLKNLIHLYEVAIIDDSLMSQKVAEKKALLEKFFHVHYSVNELVQKANGEEINQYIYRIMFSGLKRNQSKIQREIRSERGLIKTLDLLEESLNTRKSDVLTVLKPFNEKQNGILRITYSQDLKLDYTLNFEVLLYGEYGCKKNSLYHHFNIYKETIVDYLESLSSKIGLPKLLRLFLMKKYAEINHINDIGSFSLDLTEKLIERGVRTVEENQEEVLDLIQKKLFNNNIAKINNFLCELPNTSDNFNLEFNINNKEQGEHLPELYRNIRDLSLGQKVVALLSFVIGYSEFSNDFTPLIIDQPEDNLDNQYIYKNLVKQLRDIKSKRQIILATHNATIVTNAKAEQVIVMESNNINGWINKEGYPTEKGIKQSIINLLEGGKESFKHKCFIYEDLLN